MTDFPLQAYLNRIGLKGGVSQTPKGLDTLHRAQTCTIPFENFDVLLGRKIDIRAHALIEKLLGQKRGGYCFELNGLFFLALTAMGFDARFVLARVHVSDAASPRAHVAIIVQIDGAAWLADVGFGGNGLRAPMPFALDTPADQDGVQFRLVEAPPFGVMLQTFEAGEWSNNYSFDLEHVGEADLEMGNHFASTHPESIFTKARIANILNSSGRVSLMNFSLSHVTGEKRESETLSDDPSYMDAVKSNFGIALDADYDALPGVLEPPSLDLS
ncbi:MAG: arylamine N-acetyltransferase [Pseudomonadota bacterium]